MLTTFKNDPNLLKKVITGDESWLYGYDIETKAQSFQWKRPEDPRPKSTSSSVKCKAFTHCFLRLRWHGAL